MARPGPRRRRPRTTRARKAGLPPGSLVHTGQPPPDPTRPASIRVIDYDSGSLEERVVVDAATCAAYRDTSTVTWIDVSSVHQVAVVRQLGDVFRVHPLTQEDILNIDQRAKAEDYDDYVYIVLKTLAWDETIQDIVDEQLSIILGRGFVLSFGERPGDDGFETLRDRLRQQRGRIRRMGADYLAYSLLDTVVDRYFLVLEKMEDRVEQLEERLLAGSEGGPEAIQQIRRETLYLRHAVWPLRELIDALRYPDLELIGEETRVYLKDVHDHTMQVIDMLEGLRETITSLNEVHLSVLNSRLNETMKVLTLFAAVFIPLTFLVGVYGMNFEYMPELRWPWAYPALWATMIGIGVGLVVFFRRRRWI